MYICLYDTFADINMSFCVCRDEFWQTSRSSFQGDFVRSTSVLTCLWLDGNPSGDIMMLNITEASLI